MLLFEFFADLASSFRNPPPLLEDGDDEANESMSLVDNNFESGLLGANDCLSALLPSPLCERPVLDGRSTLFSKRDGATRRARSTAARYNAYSLPSREQRHALTRYSRRKEMFINGLGDTFVPLAVPSTVHPIDDLALLSVHEDMAAPHVEEHEHLTHIPNDAQSESDLTVTIPGTVDRLSLQLMDSCVVSEQTEEDEDVIDYATQNSGLTIKIPGLVDRLALLLLGSCNVNEQTEEGEDTDNLSLGGSISSESSSSDSEDIDDDRNSSSYSSSSPVLTAGGPDRTSRRRHRHIAAPYRRAERIPKRKELWIDTDNTTGSEVPVFLLGSPASALRSDRYF